MRRLRLLGSIAALVLVAVTPSRAQAPGALPQGEGRDLVAVACSQCHTLATIIVGREGPSGWRKHVHNMVLRGAQLNATEAETVIKYLSAHFGPGAQPAATPGGTPISLPSGTGKDLVEARCTACHDLERVTIVKRKARDWPAIVANMVERGATATPDEARTIAAYLVAQFGTD
jgi:cytochrome c5